MADSSSSVPFRLCKLIKKVSKESQSINRSLNIFIQFGHLGVYYSKFPCAASVGSGVIVHGQIWGGGMLHVHMQKRGRLLFFSPWRRGALIGTSIALPLYTPSWQCMYFFFFAGKGGGGGEKNVLCRRLAAETNTCFDPDLTRTLGWMMTRMKMM
ncbi:hypothetical protein K440DRAFT_385283 [Wilcoxina mikolae CBS 423.85]|nr:hypothetical protein K440DRAFT_385283 [Wilcoxina mikolae CBS 423.85]